METYNNLLCFRLGVLTRKINRYYNNQYARYGITIGQSFILFDLLINECSSLKDIAARVQLDSPAVTGFIDRLVREDLVERQEDPCDRRSLCISLTEKGQKLVEKILPIAKQFNRQIKDILIPSDLEAFERSLERLGTGHLYKDLP